MPLVNGSRQYERWLDIIRLGHERRKRARYDVHKARREMVNMGAAHNARTGRMSECAEQVVYGGELRSAAPYRPTVVAPELPRLIAVGSVPSPLAPGLDVSASMQHPAPRRPERGELLVREVT